MGGESCTNAKAKYSGSVVPPDPSVHFHHCVAPSASAMRRLLSICDDFASEYSISFNATKSKCMVISPHTRRNVQYCEFMVHGKPMEFVSSYVHLGHLISDTSCDISQRRCDFIGQVNNVLCYFQKLSSAVMYKLFQSYCTILRM